MQNNDNVVETASSDDNSPSTVSTNQQARLSWLVPIMIMLWVMAMVCFLCWERQCHVGLNLTPSMPIGWYQQCQVKQIQRGDIVAVCLPQAIATVGLANGYLTKGTCPDGSMPVLKRVIALPGDTVIVTPAQLIVNGHAYFAPQWQRDPQGHIMHYFIHDKRYSPIKTYWLYGSHNQIYSWDSRYYGGVPRSAIQGVYQPLLLVS